MTQNSKRRRKKKRNQSSPSNCHKERNQNDDKQNLESLEAEVDSLSLSDPNATRSLGLSRANVDDPSSSSVSGSVSSGDTSTLGMVVKGRKQKRVVAATGTVSTMLGKDYLRKDAVAAKKEFCNNEFDEEEAVEFLSSMLGYDSELSVAVIRDVLGQCGFNIQKAIDVLLDLSTSTSGQSTGSRSFNSKIIYGEDDVFPLEQNDSMNDRASDCTSSSESDHISFWGFDYRNYAQALAGFEAPSPMRSNQSDLPQKVLNSLFNISKSSVHEPGTMNWRDIVKKMQILQPSLHSNSSGEGISQQAKDEYHVLRKPATEHWDSVRSYYQKAASAYSKGERAYAAYLSDQGRVQTELAQVADRKASQHIFKARNKSIENVLTIDLHGQHVKEAMRLLKLHLLFGTYVHSFQTLRVITGCGSHGVGKSKLKQSVIKLLQNEGIVWSEENRGTLLIKIEANKEYNFLDLDNDAE